MTATLRRYLELEQRLVEWRQTHSEDTPEEDDILDQMDYSWWQLSEEDIRWIRARDPAADSP